MKIVGGNLLKVCQRTFLLSKEESNDELLINENIAGYYQGRGHTSDTCDTTHMYMYMYCIVFVIVLDHRCLVEILFSFGPFIYHYRTPC